MNALVQTTLRTITKTVAGFLIAKGLKVDDSTQEVIYGALLLFGSWVWGLLHHLKFFQKIAPEQQLKLFVLLLIPFFSGCASFKSTQTETQADGTVRSTVVKVRTFWDSKSDLAKLRASTTDKTQGLTVSGLSEASSGTNTVALLDSVTRLIQAVPK